MAEFETKFQDFKEQKVDSMRAQKEEELLQQQKEKERMKRFEKGGEKGGLKVKSLKKRT